MAKPVYSRILLKLSGETLKGNLEHGYDPDSCRKAAARIKSIIDRGVQVAIVVGAGNIWRGGRAGSMMNRVDADKMGMLATAMNALMLKNVFQDLGIEVLLQCAIPMAGFLPVYETDNAVAALEKNFYR